MGLVKLCLFLSVVSLVHSIPVTHRLVNITSPRVQGPGFTRVYSQHGQAGYYYDFTDYVPDLSVYNFDNMACSACVTGMWMYYEHTQYDKQGGAVYWMHGIEFCGDFPAEYSGIASSLRYAGSPYGLNDDCFTLYEGKYFTGDEYWGNTNFATLDYLNDRASSLILNGHSPWTLYSEPNYGGFSLCVYPNTDHDVGPDDSTVIDLGIFGSMTDIGFPDNSVSSVAKGCHSAHIAWPKPLKATHKTSNGAMGVIFNNN